MILGEGAVFILILMAGFWQIQKSIQKEIELSKSKNNFMLSITHELKTPLTSIQLALQTLSKRDLNDLQRKDLIEKAISENNRLNLLIDNILNASRIENKGLVPDKKTVNLNDLLKRVVSEANKRHQKEQIKLIANIGSITVDAFMIETSLINIIENAIKYGGDDEIIIEGEAVNNAYEISIKDKGPGIPESEKVNIFDKFYRIGNEETRIKKGSGLGLYIAKEFVRLHMGEITYQENLPKGSIFTIRLPNDK
jgi:K+-sensing histidine kinase KdpD